MDRHHRLPFLAVGYQILAACLHSTHILPSSFRCLLYRSTFPERNLCPEQE
ncbi:hypothetical protein EVA_14751 [gut metagenome]|uniref:Uncharacterized protein n=1 Tax=gut metagenome TaxID=749906 RepID=J9CB64_9ZZZZ